MDIPIFDNLNIAVVPANISQKRFSLFESQIKKYGGTCTAVSNLSICTHVVFDEEYYTKNKTLEDVMKMIDIHQYDDLTFEVVSSKWLILCIMEKKLVDIKPYRFKQKVEDENLAATEESFVYNLPQCIVDIMTKRSADTGKITSDKKETIWDDTWRQRDDTWHRHMAFIRKGFFVTGVVPRYN